MKEKTAYLISIMQNAFRPKRKMTKMRSITFWVVVIVALGVAVWIGSYHETTGRFPISFLNSHQSILPPKMDSQGQSYEQVINFIRTDDTNNIPYGVGFNCVDATFRVWRSAVWKGIQAYPIIVQYSESPGHMVIAFPTNDHGDVFIEPQSDLEIRLAVDQNYNNRPVRGFYVLDYDPLPLDNSPPIDLNMGAE
jgi:hypothetical protein